MRILPILFLLPGFAFAGDFVLQAPVFSELLRAEVSQVWEQPPAPAAAIRPKTECEPWSEEKELEKLPLPAGKVNLHMVQVRQVENGWAQSYGTSVNDRVHSVPAPKRNKGPQKFTVRVKASDRPYVLVLSSMLPLRWTVELDKGASLERIVLRDTSFQELHSEVIVLGVKDVRVEYVDFKWQHVLLAGQSRFELDKVAEKDRPGRLRKYEELRRGSLSPELCSLSRRFKTRPEFQTRHLASEITVGPCPEGAATKETYCR